MRLHNFFLGLVIISCSGCSIPSLPNPTNPTAASSSNSSSLFKNMPNFSFSIPLFGHTQCYMDNGVKVCPSSPSLPAKPYMEPPSSSQLLGN